MKIAKKSHTIQLVLGMLVAATFCLGASSCDDSMDLKNWVDNTEKLKIEAQNQAKVKPYAGPQQKALKDYFVELADMSLALKNDTNYAKRFNEALAKNDINAVCGKVLMQKDWWTYIMSRCTKNNFFLCAEEVRAYPDIVSAMRGSLVAEQQKRFDKAPSCKGALEVNR